MSADQKNMELMKTLDDAWNTQDWDTFEERHDDAVAVFWLGQLEPTKGLHNHREESVGFFRTFPDNHLVNNPYKLFYILIMIPLRALKRQVKSMKTISNLL